MDIFWQYMIQQSWKNWFDLNGNAGFACIFLYLTDLYYLLHVTITKNNIAEQVLLFEVSTVNLFPL